MRNLTTLSLLTIGLALGSSVAMAKPYENLENCLPGDVSPTANACDGYFDGLNDQLQDPLTVNTLNLFNYDDWLFGSKDEGSQEVNTELDPQAVITLTSGFGQDAGEWFISNYSSLVAAYEDAMIVLKGANGFNAYFFEGFTGASGESIETGEWTMFTDFDRDGDRRTQAISHISLYVRGEGDTPPPPGEVPVPATVLLFGLGLGGLALRRRRT